MPALRVQIPQVVSNAHAVSLQLLVHSSKKWEAHVVSICPTFDLALLTLKEKDSFMDELAAKDMRLRPLELSSGAATMGHPVVALGFPLGMDSLKISAGVVAGNEEVQGNVCIQSTAPISPGSSGGPLLNEDGTKVDYALVGGGLQGCIWCRTPLGLLSC